jgi:cytochrome c oxidase subunit 2
MARTDLTILIAYALAVALSMAVALAIWVSTRRRGEVDTHRLAESERRWLVVVVTLLVVLLAATIWFIPYGKSTPADAQMVRVNAQQFFWSITPSTVRAGRPVAFITRSRVVSHGFGIFKGHRFIAQIQVVPDSSSTLVHTFTETGTYTVLCLEFCGVNHHGMVASFKVVK